MSVPIKILEKYDVKLVTKWTPPEGDDLRPLIAMPNIPKPLHGVAPRTLFGATTWNQMRKECYANANDTCEICGDKPDNPRHRHGHEVYEIDYEKGVAKFVRVFCICSMDHLACIHTGRAITLFKHGNLLYPKEFLLEGAEKAFAMIQSYNKDHPDADLRAYATFLEYLKNDELKKPMEELIKKYDMKFYMEDPKKMADWKYWVLRVGDQVFMTPYENERDWEKAMKQKEKSDTARLAQRTMEQKFSGEVYDEIDNILKEAKK